MPDRTPQPEISASASSDLTSRGAVGGAANESGSLFRANVATWFVAHALRGSPILDLRLGPGAVPTAVGLETDSAVDDIAVDFAGGGRAVVQAKRSLQVSGKADSDLASVTRQWIASIRGGLTPGRDRLVLAIGEATAPLHALRSGFERHRGPSGKPSKREEEAFAVLESHLACLTVDERRALNEMAVILFFDFESVIGSSDAWNQILESHVVSHGEGRLAWDALSAEARRLAAKRQGRRTREWLAVLRDAGLTLICDKDGAEAARLEAARQCLRRYRGVLRERGSLIELLAFADVPPIRVDDVASGLEGSSSHFGERKELLLLLRRGARVLLTGLPGSGKSTALNQIAARYAAREDGPVPLVVRLTAFAKHLDRPDPVEALVDLAAAFATTEDRPLVVGELREALRNGRAALLLDGLDECRDKRAAVVERLRQALAAVHSDVEVVLSTRDTALGTARTLELEEVRLETLLARTLFRRCPPALFRVA